MFRIVFDVVDMVSTGAFLRTFFTADATPVMVP
jgi:hypothetical protein